ncbi:MAG: hypothetical protein IPL77_10405 [Flavobacteriales bacterium]|nr:hypothetical protein [Flavobacteriales bacterium]
MPFSIALAPFHLRFKHPFGTAHGVRTGTDSVFVRVSSGPHVGYGEATLPPYVKETQASVLARLRSFEKEEVRSNDLISFFAWLDADLAFGKAPAARSAISMAFIDLVSRRSATPVEDLLGVSQLSKPKSMATIGLCEPHEVAEKLDELPAMPVLKIKLGGSHDLAVLKEVIDLTERRIFLDANQGLSSVSDALTLIRQAGGAERVFGMEQPFSVDRPDLTADLARRTPVTVYADESVQTLRDLDRAVGIFGGVNVKLMKCGGLDRALQVIHRAREIGMRVMLGSMSESSLGCGAMARLSGMADLCDLDGPWLLANDPFTGFDWGENGFKWKEGPGLGIVPAVQLPFDPIGA